MSRTRVTVGLAVVALGAVLLVAVTGYGRSGHGRASGPFGWLRPGSPPTGWNVAHTRGDAVLAYPPGWTPVKTDPGTASVALFGGGERLGPLAATTTARFRSGRGACVIDTYTTSKASYREIACLVSGPGSSAVVVAAAPTALWDQQAPTLQQAVSSFVA